jgi:hypothetical protein
MSLVYICPLPLMGLIRWVSKEEMEKSAHFMYEAIGVDASMKKQEDKQNDNRTIVPYPSSAD